MSRKTLALLAAGAASVSAHGVIVDISTGGKTYEGWSPNYVYENPVPDVAAWHAGGYGMGPVTDFSSESMNCHDNATAATAYMNAAAGADLNIVWGQFGGGSGWPESHKGPIATYMAPCGDGATGDCTSLSVMDLKWTKVYQSGLLTPGTTDEQVWATDKLRENNKTVATIPSALKAGNYVLRNEIIALHSAGTAGGAQPYPQCYNVKVTGSGSEALPADGVAGGSLYTEKDLVFNIYDTVSDYPIPGPALWSGAGGSSSGGSTPAAGTPAAGTPATTPVVASTPVAATPTTLQTVAKTTPAAQATPSAANVASTGDDEYDC
ncbi:glycosyl hydrolase family 61-domain-containing protein [Phyllosticta citriasiana]|uniref:Glycosyl hydrolase family 61-domain-containing protein n=1 Tax=Phyllosticta citriasiana TaxID=595635 RepID=A0ABR1KJP7_9PEZI